ncbi:hypothetical protein AYR62_03855 [Secundilactobacillus paracollinoides]|uniref:DUF1146 domain-containing protein n=1 Tax=Secundilactobacillus paracollinoides TaxID=240427 RepID=A0A1B2IZW5_9LACO|nr:DUF1146 family protein [Secundilactobacillus paracollinoides]ANZ61683.1 hypothetical protein AYR61_10145 [Secundilactobacillus paracollinoides]ANZ63320.1 hypothetical protein AYR62_03855 [Secundilactobacillus paracollinoides]ANZ67601.1 hypothetical protein AYR63_10890 [Secundilactobacillus paracollinoides]KRL76003.1 hypothetical protein FC17_GL002316 [Secundilactobacillus paracollinoides DSM 15502 = JCM 11969]
MRTIGTQALLTLISHFIFIFVAFWSIQKLHIENLMRLYPTQARVLIVMLSVTVGYTCSSFFLNFIDNVRNLIYIVK